MKARESMEISRRQWWEFAGGLPILSLNSISKKRSFRAALKFQWDHHLSLHPVQFNCYFNGSCDYLKASVLPFGCSSNIWASFALFISVVDSMMCSPISTRKAMDSFHCCVEAQVNHLCAFFFSKINGKKIKK